jgi:hypothetical protein
MDRNDVEASNLQGTVKAQNAAQPATANFNSHINGMRPLDSEKDRMVTKRLPSMKRQRRFVYRIKNQEVFMGSHD